MNSATIWILVPIFVGGVLFVLQRFEKALVLAGTGLVVLLALMAWFLPIGEALPFLPSITIQDTMFVLGRQFILSDTDRPYLFLIYLMVAIWLGGSAAARSGNYLVPVGLIVSGLLTAALAVEPTLYAALLIEMAALVSIPVLAPPGRPASRGVLRFITFQTLGMPFILLSGWLLPGVVSDPPSQPVMTAIVLLLLGFALLMAIFPFHSWLISLAGEVNPYNAAFIFFLILSTVSIFGVDFINRLEWLRGFAPLYSILRLLGILMIFTGGLWAAFQRHLGRMLGYAMLVIVGSSLLASSLGAPVADLGANASAIASPATGLFFAFFLPNGLALATWTLSLSIFRNQTENLTYRSVQGLAYTLPVASAGLLAAHFSLASLPLLAGFPLYSAMFSSLSHSAPTAVFLAMLGMGGLLAGALRTLAVLITSPNESPAWSMTETRLQAILIVAAIILLFVMGLFPQLYLPLLSELIP
jgi:NADH-quinone oxidoreductase subunit N